MIGSDNKVTDIRRSRGLGGPNSNGGGSGDLTNYRLERLEDRMGVVESKVDDLIVTCARIDEKLNNLASKSYVLWIFGGTALTLIVTIVGHLLIRSMTGS